MHCSRSNENWYQKQKKNTSRKTLNNNLADNYDIPWVSFRERKNFSHLTHNQRFFATADDELNDQKDFSAPFIQGILYIRKLVWCVSHREKVSIERKKENCKIHENWELFFLPKLSLVSFLWCCERTNKLSFNIGALSALSSISFIHIFHLITLLWPSTWLEERQKVTSYNSAWVCEKTTFVVCLICWMELRWKKPWNLRWKIFQVPLKLTEIFGLYFA